MIYLFPLMLDSARFSLRFRNVQALACSLFLFVFCCQLVAKERVAKETPNDAQVSLKATHGLGGIWKVGFPTATKVEVTAQRAIKGYLQLQTMDGDGIPMTYAAQEWTVDLAAGQTQSVEIYAQHGRASEPIRIQLVEGEEIAASLELTSTERGQTLPATQTWLVNLGGSLDLEQAALRTGGGGLSSFTVSHLERPEQFPESERGYDGVSLIAISTKDLSWVNALNAKQSSAIIQWVLHGGRVLVSLGESCLQLPKDSWLQSLLLGTIQDRLTDVDPGPLESWVNSGTPLQSLTCVRMESPKAIVDLTAMTSRREPFPMVLRYAMGFGQVTLLATDLDSEMLYKWNDRKNLTEKLIGRQVRANENATSYTMGFSDLSGQLRAALDVFPAVQSVTLTTLAFIVLLFLVLIGPIDYFVFNVWLKRPKWTWTTLMITTLISCAAIAWFRDSWKPKTLLLNSLDVMDIDQQTGTVMGTSWMHLYSGNEGLYDVESKVLPIGDSSVEIRQTTLDWMGLPGSGLGGFESAVSSDRGMPSYQIAGKGSSTMIHQMGIQTAATKSLQSHWVGEMKLKDETDLRVVLGSDLLEGVWQNGLEVDLLDASLMYRNWQYQMPSRVRAGQKIEFTVMSEPKDLARRFQRRQVVEGSERSVPWDPESRSDLDRLLEMLLFYQAAGGEGYVHLSHRYLNRYDYSDLLKMDRAIVLGRISQPMKSLKVKYSLGEHQESSEVMTGDEGDKHRQSWIRLVLPVHVQRRASDPVRSSKKMESSADD